MREYGGMESSGNIANFLSTYPTMSSRDGDFVRDNQQQQQTSSSYSQRRNLHEKFVIFFAC